MLQLPNGCNADLSSNGISRENFPTDFTFGTSSAAYQVMPQIGYSFRSYALCVYSSKIEFGKVHENRSAVQHASDYHLLGAAFIPGPEPRVIHLASFLVKESVTRLPYLHPSFHVSWQIEGSIAADGRGVSTWDVFAHIPGMHQHILIFSAPGRGL